MNLKQRPSTRPTQNTSSSTHSTNRSTALALAISAILLATPAAFAQQYDLQVLDSLDSGIFDNAGASAINESLQVAGWSADANGKVFAVIWQPDGSITNLGTLGINGETTSVAKDLNDSAWAVGVSSEESGGDIRFTNRAFLYRNGQMENLGMLPNATSSDAQAINNLGDVVGFCRFFDEATNRWSSHAAKWDHTTETWSDLEMFPNGSSSATDINDQGDVIGWDHDENFNWHYVIWKQDGSIVDLADSFSRTITAINNQGEVVGSKYTGVDNEYIAVSWKNGITTELGYLGKTQFKSHVSEALGLSDDGRIVGFSSSKNQYLSPFILQNEVMLDLDMLHNTFNIPLRAHDLTSTGVVLVSGSAGSADRPMIMTPINYPIALANPNPGTAGTTNTFAADGATPGNKIYFVYGFKEARELWGAAEVPGCPGLWVNIKNPIIAASVNADAVGHAEFSAPVPPSFAGSVLMMEAVDPAQCTLSNLVAYRFPQ